MFDNMKFALGCATASNRDIGIKDYAACQGETIARSHGADSQLQGPQSRTLVSARSPNVAGSDVPSRENLLLAGGQLTAMTSAPHLAAVKTLKAVVLLNSSGIARSGRAALFQAFKSWHQNIFAASNRTSQVFLHRNPSISFSVGLDKAPCSSKFSKFPCFSKRSTPF